MRIIFLSIFVLSFVFPVSAQTPEPSPSRRQRVVVGGANQQVPTTTPTPVAYPQPTPTIVPKVVVTNNLPSPTPTPKFKGATASPTPFSNAAEIEAILNRSNATTTPRDPRSLSFGEIQNKIEEAKRLMQNRLTPTAMISSSVDTNFVRMAYYDRTRNQIDFVVIAKEVFLSKNSDVTTTNSSGKLVRVQVLRANGVNTAVSIVDEGNSHQMPLIVQYPIEKFGQFREMAYYVSAHPALTTSEVFAAGKIYVRNTIDVARAKLKQKGIVISPQIADVAERLSTVEHVDHQRFWTESHINIYNEIFALYALNEGNTYRYSVSSAGAGGMVQMIPSTYSMIRSRYYSVGLIPDFVEGMRNHQNAAQAMLLYIQLTWNDLIANETVYNAYTSGIAPQADLLAAGYNSNPAKLAGYIRRGGTEWRTLIPRETKIYLQIYESLDKAVPMTPRKF